jgi:hypothetical protein
MTPLCSRILPDSSAVNSYIFQQVTDTATQAEPTNAYRVRGKPELAGDISHTVSFGSPPSNHPLIFAQDVPYPSEKLGGRCALLGRLYGEGSTQLGLPLVNVDRLPCRFAPDVVCAVSRDGVQVRQKARGIGEFAEIAVAQQTNENLLRGILREVHATA